MPVISIRTCYTLSVICLLALPASSRADLLTVNYSETGTINLAPLSITATAVGDPSLGTYTAQVQYSTTAPNWDFAGAFIAHSSTDRLFPEPTDIGYGLGTSLLTLTSGNYTIDRTVSYVLQSTGAVIGSASFAGQIARIDASTVSLTGNIAASGDWTGLNVVSIQSYTDLWTPDGPGRVLSSMTVPYVTQSGDIVLARTESLFTFAPEISLPSAQLASTSYSFSRNGDTQFEFTFSGTISAVPEPSTFILAGLGLLGALTLRRRRR